MLSIEFANECLLDRFGDETLKFGEIFFGFLTIHVLYGKLWFSTGMSGMSHMILPLGHMRASSSSSSAAGAASGSRRARPAMSAPRRTARRRRRRAAAPRHHTPSPAAPRRAAPLAPRPTPRAPTGAPRTPLPPLYANPLNTISFKFNSFRVFIYYTLFTSSRRRRRVPPESLPSPSAPRLGLSSHGVFLSIVVERSAATVGQRSRRCADWRRRRLAQPRRRPFTRRPPALARRPPGTCLGIVRAAPPLIMLIFLPSRNLILLFDFVFNEF